MAGDRIYRGTHGDTPPPPKPLPGSKAEFAARFEPRLKAAREAVPALRFAMKEAGAPAWVMAAIKMIGKWAPILAALAAQLLPLFADGTAQKVGGTAEPLDDPDLHPAAKSAIRALRAGTLEE